VTSVDTRVAIAGVAITLVAAVAASGITAWSTGQAQDRELRQQLEVLNQERSEQDRRELRGVVDEAAFVLDSAKDAMTEVLPDTGLVAADRRDELERDWPKAARWVERARRSNVKLQVRLGDDHPLALAYFYAIATLDNGFDCVFEPDSRRADEARESTRNSLDAAQRSFNGIAPRVVGSVLDGRRPPRPAKPRAPGLILCEEGRALRGR
jgi:hypothetical protein